MPNIPFYTLVDSPINQAKLPIILPMVIFIIVSNRMFANVIMMCTCNNIYSGMVSCHAYYSRIMLSHSD